MRNRRIFRLDAAFGVLTAITLLVACGDSAEPDGGQLQGGADVSAPTLTPSPAPTLVPSPAPEADPSLLLPDLRTTEPAELYIDYAQGRKELRFSTTVENIGAGPVRVVGALNASGVSAIASQVIERRDRTPLQRIIGRMNRDRQHGHWHLDNFAVFELWTYREGGVLDQMLASTPKITFCLLDMFKSDPSPVVVAEKPTFIQCDWREQGVSPGWSEVYPAELPGQELDVTGIPDGRYALRTVLDPEGQFLEADTANNTSTIFVELSASVVRQLDGPS